MLTLHLNQMIYAATAPVDFRKGITGLMALCKQIMKQDPFSGHMFVFRNRAGTAVKILNYDHNGFCCYHKRFSKGKLTGWPPEHAVMAPLSSSQLQIFLKQVPQAAAGP